MTWQRVDPKAKTPAGWCWSAIAEDDTLTILERDTKLSALVIAEKNGVPNPGRKSCAWGRDVAAWVLGTGGFRQPFTPSTPNTCEPGQGFPSFVPGQVILLPNGIRRCVTPSATVPVKNTSNVWTYVAGGLAALALLGGGLAAKKRKRSA